MLCVKKRLCQKSSDKMSTTLDHTEFKGVESEEVKLFLPLFMLIMNVIKVSRDIKVEFMLN